MKNLFEKYLLHPIEKEITDADAKVELICSKDHPIMEVFYESCYYRHDYVISDTIYALPYNEIFCFVSTNNNDDVLDAKVEMEINGQKLWVDRPCMIQIPAFVPHGNIEITDVKTPVFSYAAGFGREHVGIPEANWKREDVLLPEEMVLFCNADPNGDPHANSHQHYIFKCLANKTMKGDISGVFRRFDKTDGWVYVQQAHSHGYPETLGYYGTDGWNPYALGGSYTLFVGGHPFTVDKPTLGYFPAYVPHCPIAVHTIEKQNFWHSFGRAIGSFNAAKSIELPNIRYPDGAVELPEPWD